MRFGGVLFRVARTRRCQARCRSAHSCGCAVSTSPLLYPRPLRWPSPPGAGDSGQNPTNPKEVRNRWQRSSPTRRTRRRCERSSVRDAMHIGAHHLHARHAARGGRAPHGRAPRPRDRGVGEDTASGASSPTSTSSRCSRAATGQFTAADAAATDVCRSRPTTRSSTPRSSSASTSRLTDRRRARRRSGRSASSRRSTWPASSPASARSTTLRDARRERHDADVATVTTVDVAEDVATLLVERDISGVPVVTARASSSVWSPNATCSPRSAPTSAGPTGCSAGSSARTSTPRSTGRARPARR